MNAKLFSIHSEAANGSVPYKKAVLKYFAIFTGKHMC